MLGLALAIAGTGLRARSIAELGRFFTFELGLRSDHALVERGPYRWLMHPAYSGTLLLEAGMVIAFGAWLVGLPLVAGAVIFLLRRMRDEEAALRARFGASFEAYAASRWRLVPGVY
jgi:protein-S-isoprenylcysteine O-methyltransferase Ste14